MKRSRCALRMVLVYAALSFFCICSAIAQTAAQTVAPQEPPAELQVTILDERIDLEPLGPNISVKRVEDRAKLRVNPSVEQREKLLEHSDLAQATRSWKHFDKDVLLMRARSMASADLEKAYPSLPAEALQKLQAMHIDGGK